MKQHCIDELLGVVAALSSAWGRDSIRISVPKAWKPLRNGLSEEEAALFSFNTADKVVVKVIVNELTILSYAIDSSRLSLEVFSPTA
jgi:hypothetical protein